MVATALTGPVGGMVAKKIAGALGTEETPEAIEQYLKENPKAMLEARMAELETDRDIAVAAFEARTKQLEIINETMRAETNSDDAYVRRWRPTYGYMVAISWFIQMTGFTILFVYMGIKQPSELAKVIQQLALFGGTLMSLWTVALAVLGVSVHERSKEKRDQKPKGILGTLLNR